MGGGKMAGWLWMTGEAEYAWKEENIEGSNMLVGAVGM